jgi:uncharacterized surface protein with fasciclin (FAS1) repeats
MNTTSKSSGNAVSKTSGNAASKTSGNAAPKVSGNVESKASGNAVAQNLVQAAAGQGSFKTFSKAVESAGLTQVLSGPAPFTVFAPTDAAFEQLPAGKLDMLLKPENKAELVSMVNYHVVPGRRSFVDIGQWNAAKTVQGTSAPIVLDGTKLTIDGAQVTEMDIESSNGLIHGIDKVNFPITPATKQ